MLKERPALIGAGEFVGTNLRPQTRDMLIKLAKHLHWNAYEVVHALVEAEAKAQGLAK